ncbi:uroporphyrinogen-III synthase [Sphingosinithalassobacter sp. LHW66-3]|uniref:uroporphyrinogen-III synthase n=1 Tax=Sphingosinithalassobacter sp. LHW66-3 TaxID=3424718 RepID=UPI003D6ABCEF
MSRPIAVLRPEPGNRVTAAAVEATGRRAIRLPLFDVVPVPWQAPDPREYDALLLTSANAVRHAGPELAALLALPVHAVGEATAGAARRAGFVVAAIGHDGAHTLIAAAAGAGVRRALHLAGRDRLIEQGGIIADVRTVYASEPREIAEAAAQRLSGAVAMVHSPRAAARLAAVLDASRVARGSVAVAAISERTRRALGSGWERVAVAAVPEDDTLRDVALRLAD